MTVAAIVATSLLWSVSATAQTTTTTSNAGSSSASSAQVESSAGAYASGGTGGNSNSNAQIYIDQSTPETITTRQQYTGKYTVRSAPAVQPPSMGSGHPCALASSIGISLIGGGAAGGLGRVDEACLLAQMGQGQAALLMIARRDSEACVALRQVGTIPSNSVCSATERRQAARAQRASAPQVSRQAATPATPRPIASYVRCSRRSDGKILAQRQRGTPYTDAQVADYCRGQIK
ncbi:MULTISPECIES: hypothetical protein [Pseudooceanicola]|uniref:hypothetical protein n=1 Tax=Pseudooceanicola TaxID=1679449 RepID=UPI0013679D23|nr:MULTISPECIES: hypothetical protein [Pseudooceanicola]